MRSIVASLLAVVALSCARASAQVTVTPNFTYQGELRASGSPVATPVDLRFRLYDAATAGAQVGPQLSATLTPSAGRFSVDLNFGNVFLGQARWLEIDARAAGTPTYSTLSPRQLLSVAPNAAFALTASSASSATQLNGQSASYYTNAANLNSGTIPDARLSGVYSGPLALTSTSNAFTGSGLGLTSLNASSLSDGTVADARLSTNIPRLNTPNTFGPVPNVFEGPVSLKIFQLTQMPHPGDVLTSDDLGVGTWQPPRTLELPFEASATIPFPGCVFSITSTTPFSPAICGNNTAPFGNGIGIQGYAASPTGTGIYGFSATGVRGESITPNGFGVVGYSAQSGAVGVYGNADIGVRGESTTPNGNGVVGYASGGNDAWAVSGETATGQAVIGRAGNSPPGGGFPPATGIVGYTNIGGGFTQGIGVYGEAASPTGLTLGGYFKNASNSGTALRAWATSTTGNTYGGDFATSGNNFAAAIRASAVASSGNTYGGDFSAESTDGIAVRARANALTGFTWGGWFESRSVNFGTGVFGYATAPTGVTYGVYGSTISSDPNAYGVFASGRLGASGTKSFRIDHPLDPDNKYLLHYSIESPEVLNAYSGKVTLDGAGNATVDLPDYFAAVNKDPRYTLTPLGAPMPLLHIAQEIDESALTAGAAAAQGQPVPACSFRIGGGAPGAKVSWRIEAIRNDRWVRDHGAPVELNKQPGEKPSGQHPYAQSPATLD